MDAQISHIILIIAFIILLVAFLLSLIRLVRGPSVNDRIAAMDLIAFHYIGIILIYALFTRDHIYVDVPLIVSLVAFMGTVAISYYIKQKNE